jgi:hypothetical protein
LAAALERLAALPLPAGLGLKTPEGFAYYGLHPETYLAAARGFAAAKAPARAVCIGLRGIGASLSAVVAAGLEAEEGWAVESLTLRPRGHPFARRPVLDHDLAGRLAARAGAWFLIVDEGPGLSGSSFCGTAACLAELGVPDERIVFFPSHQPDPEALVDEAARRRWPMHASCHIAFSAAVLDDPPWPADAAELSGGAWRDRLYAPGEPRPAVLPWQERRKLLSTAPRPVLHKFVGLGRFGARARARAEALAVAGLAPPVLGLSQGYLMQAFVPGRPLRRNEGDGTFLRFAARYLGHLGRCGSTGESARPTSLLPMALANIQEALGHRPPAALERHAAALPEAPAVELYGRVLPHEWLRLDDGSHLKTDALDHHADHGFPGPADIAWDVAGLLVEFDLTEPMATEFVAAAGATVSDPSLSQRLPFYEVAYLAWRCGFTAFAADSLKGAPDGLRMRRACARYRALLAQRLARL